MLPRPRAGGVGGVGGICDSGSLRSKTPLQKCPPPALLQVLPGAGISPLMLIYGFPISLLGFALAYAQVGGSLGCVAERTVGAPCYRRTRALHLHGTSVRSCWAVPWHVGRWARLKDASSAAWGGVGQRCGGSVRVMAHVRREATGVPTSAVRPQPPSLQLEPVPCKTTRSAFALRESQMTDNQKQIREDTTRYRCVLWGVGQQRAPSHCVSRVLVRDAGLPTPECTTTTTTTHAGMGMSCTWRRL